MNLVDRFDELLDFAFLQDRNRTIRDIKLCACGKVPREDNLFARAVMSTKPPAPAVTWGRTPSLETLIEPPLSICRNESSDMSNPAPWNT